MDSVTRRRRALAAVLLALSIGATQAACSAAPPTPFPEVAFSRFAPLEVELHGEPDWLGSTAGSLWVKRDDGVVTRVDPETGEILADIDAKLVRNERPCNGLGVTADAVWTCSDQSLVRIDPATNEVSATVPVGKIWAQGRLVEAAGRIWALSGNGDQLVGVTTGEATAEEPIALPAACVDLGASGAIVYAVCTDDDTVLRIDPKTAQVTSVEIASPHHVSAAGSVVWVASGQGLLRLDPVSLATQLTIPDVVPGAFGGILATDASVWVRQERPFLIRIDPTTGALTHVITAPHGSGDVIVQGEHVWTSDVEGNALVRLTVPAG